MNLYDLGAHRWSPVYVDDRVPAKDDYVSGIGGWSNTKTKALSILLKALTKVMGAYDSAEGGSGVDVMQRMLGGEAHYNLRDRAAIYKQVGSQTEKKVYEFFHKKLLLNGGSGDTLWTESFAPGHSAPAEGLLGRERRADKNLSKCFPKGFQTCQRMTMVVVSLHTQCLDGCGDFGSIWKVVGEDLGEVISTCSDPRFGLEAHRFDSHGLQEQE